MKIAVILFVVDTQEENSAENCNETVGYKWLIV